MSELEALRSKPKARRILKGVHMNWDFPEVSYTTPSQGGAASLKNEAYLFKANKANKEDLDSDQESILETIGEKFVPLQKCSVDDNNTPSSSEVIDGEDNKLEKGTEMSQEIQKQLDALMRDNSVLRIEKSLTGFELTEEVKSGLADAMADLGKDAQSAVVKALKEISDNGESKLEKAVEKAKEGVTGKDTDLQKSLEAEAGVEGDPEADVEKSLIDKVMAHQDKGKK